MHSNILLDYYYWCVTYKYFIAVAGAISVDLYSMLLVSIINNNASYVTRWSYDFNVKLYSNQSKDYKVHYFPLKCEVEV